MSAPNRSQDKEKGRHLYRWAAICAAGTIGEEECQLSPRIGWRLYRELIDILRFHECSHAVAMLLLGVPVEQICIISTPNRLVGMASATDEQISPQKIDETETDAARAGRALGAAHKFGHHADIDKNIRSTTRLLRRHKGAVVALVDALRREGNLYGEGRIRKIAGIRYSITATVKMTGLAALVTGSETMDPSPGRSADGKARA